MVVIVDNSFVAEAGYSLVIDIDSTMIDIGSEVDVDLEADLEAAMTDVDPDLGLDFDRNIVPDPDTGSDPDTDSHLDIPETDSAPDTDSAAPLPDNTADLHSADPSSVDLDNTADPDPDLAVNEIDSVDSADRDIVRRFAGYSVDYFADDALLAQL